MKSCCAQAVGCCDRLWCLIDRVTVSRPKRFFDPNTKKACMYLGWLVSSREQKLRLGGLYTHHTRTTDQATTKCFSEHYSKTGTQQITTSMTSDFSSGDSLVASCRCIGRRVRGCLRSISDGWRRPNPVNAGVAAFSTCATTEYRRLGFARGQLNRYFVVLPLLLDGPTPAYVKLAKTRARCWRCMLSGLDFSNGPRSKAYCIIVSEKPVAQLENFSRGCFVSAASIKLFASRF